MFGLHNPHWIDWVFGFHNTYIGLIGCLAFIIHIGLIGCLAFIIHILD